MSSGSDRADLANRVRRAVRAAEQRVERLDLDAQARRQFGAARQCYAACVTRNPAADGDAEWLADQCMQYFERLGAIVQECGERRHRRSAGASDALRGQSGPGQFGGGIALTGYAAWQDRSG